MSLAQRMRAATPFLLAALFLSSAPARAASMSGDFRSMTAWLSHEVSQGIAFNAGSTFDPPREIVDRRLAPDISVGGGVMPLDMAKFPELQSDAVRTMGPQKLFPSSVMFPNLAMHLRAGLPGRFDFALRFADMTSPPGYKLSQNTLATAQSNSFGASVRRHFFGGEDPLLTLGAHYNHVYGRFEFKTKYLATPIDGFSADVDVNGGLYWNVNSYGLNAVLSQNYGLWTPFAGFGYNYVTGSVRARLNAIPDTDLILPIQGESSDHPEQNQGRAILGLQCNHSWINLFANGEIKAIGIGSGKSWIVHAGMSLPFHIGSSRGAARLEAEQRERATSVASARERARRYRLASDDEAGRERSARREIFSGGAARHEKVEGTPTMIFIQ